MIAASDGVEIAVWNNRCEPERVGRIDVPDATGLQFMRNGLVVSDRCGVALYDLTNPECSTLHQRLEIQERIERIAVRNAIVYAASQATVYIIHMKNGSLEVVGRLQLETPATHLAAHRDGVWVASENRVMFYRDLDNRLCDLL